MGLLYGVLGLFAEWEFYVLILVVFVYGVCFWDMVNGIRDRSFWKFILNFIGFVLLSLCSIIGLVEALIDN